jgi:hypothetical protein
MTHYQVEIANMVLNLVMTAQLGFVMVWTYRIYLHCYPHRSDGQPPYEEG